MENVYKVQPGYFGDSIDNIIVLENFISPDDLDRFYLYSKSIEKFLSIPEDNWDNRVHSSELFESSNKTLFLKLLEYQKKLKIEIEKRFNFVLQENSPSIVLWRPGDDQPPHADKQEQNGNPNSYPENDVASLMYINDNYDGGEIYFTNQDITIKPKAGSAIFFPGDIHYTHGVTKVLNNNRYTSPAFWRVKNFN